MTRLDNAPTLSKKTGILLVNLGTPEAPTKAALRVYLKEFLSDPRVVELNRTLWWFILNGIILRTRPAKSAKKYASIWLPEGSPLMVHSQAQYHLLHQKVQQEGLSNCHVGLAMRYGNPSIRSTVNKMLQQGVQQLIVVPLYPQYSAAASGTVYDEVFRVLMQQRNVPELIMIRSFPTDEGYIAALASQVQNHWEKHGTPDKLVMSFHGMPEASYQQGDPYYDECQITAQHLAEALNFDDVVVCFQSRFGRAKWLQPYTSDILKQLGKAKTARIDLLCPGFVSDCLETLEEIAIEGKSTFLENGGGLCHYIPCLNSNNLLINTLFSLIKKHI